MKNDMQLRQRCASGLLLALACALLTGCALNGPAPAALATAEQRALLAPSGTLKAGLYPGTPTAILPGQDGAEARGVGYELGKALAARLDVPFAPVVLEKNADVLEAVKTAAVDVAFTNATATRAKDMDFTRPYLEIEMGYLVPAGSLLKSVDDIDRPGLRVAVTAKSTSDTVLSRDLKHAVVVRALTLKEGIELLARGKADAYATNKATLFEMGDDLPGSRVLDGRWGLERHAIAIPKGRDAALPAVQKFADEARASGLVRSAAQRAGLRGMLDAEAR